MTYLKSKSLPRPEERDSKPKRSVLEQKTAYPKDSVRLVKYAATAGIASRRHTEELIRLGDLTINGRVITDPAFPVKENDEVRYQGRIVPPQSTEKLYAIMLHKPTGVLSTMVPGKERGYCLADLVSTPERLHPVGRLDQDSSGLILMTNDGELTLKLTHPSHEVEKEYVVKLHRILHPPEIEKIRRGVMLDGRVVKVSALEPDHGGRLRVVIHEGRNRIVRRLFGALNCNVLELKRIRIGSVALGTLAVGRWRKLSQKEFDSLKG